MGCDSQTKNGQTTYATTLVFHVSSTGCHVIYKKEVVPEIKDIWNSDELIKYQKLFLTKKRNTLPICSRCNQLSHGQAVNLDEYTEEILKRWRK